MFRFSVMSTIAFTLVCAAVPLNGSSHAAQPVDLLVSGAGYAGPSETLCAGTAPTGYVTTAISGACSLGGGRSAVLRTVQNRAGLPTNTRLNVCGPFTAPAGWALVAVNAKACFSMLGTTYLSGAMMNLNGLPANTTLDICGLPAPAGWRVITEESSPCSTGPTSYHKYRITKQ